MGFEMIVWKMWKVAKVPTSHGIPSVTLIMVNSFRAWNCNIRTPWPGFGALWPHPYGKNWRFVFKWRVGIKLRKNLRFKRLFLRLFSSTRALQAQSSWDWKSWVPEKAGGCTWDHGWDWLWRLRFCVTRGPLVLVETVCILESSGGTALSLSWSNWSLAVEL